MRATARTLAQRRRMLQAVAQLQRTRWQLARTHVPGPGAWLGARAAWALAPVLAALWRRWRGPE